MADSTKDDLGSDPEYIETCRIAAWAELPMSKVMQYWNATESDFAFPDGHWPEGVDGEKFVRAQLRPRRVPTGDGTPAEVPSTESVARFRQSIGDTT